MRATVRLRVDSSLSEGPGIAAISSVSLDILEYIRGF